MPNKINIRPIITKMLEYEKSYLHMGSELMSISILFYYLSSRCGGLTNEVLMQEGLINEGLINDEPAVQRTAHTAPLKTEHGPINESWP